MDVNKLVAAVLRVVGDAPKPVSLHEPRFIGKEREYVLECLDTGWVSSVGKYVDRFERDLEAFTGARHAVVVANGTAALQVAYRLAGVEAGDEILMPALTFVATANAAAHLGARPHFVDSHPEHLGVDVQRLAQHLAQNTQRKDGILVNRQTGARIRAAVTMHVFGHMGDVQALASLCKDYGLPLVEDAAEALGSKRDGQHAGLFGVMGTLSFNGNKVVTTGGGGAIITQDAALAKHAKHLTTTARAPHAWEYFHDELGYNYRLPNINAALGCAQLESLPGQMQHKAHLAKAYQLALAEVAGVTFLTPPPGSASNHWLNAVRLGVEDLEQRNAVLAGLHQAGIQARPIWMLMHRLPMYAGNPRMELTAAEKLEKTIINLPSSAFLAGHIPGALREAP